MSSNLLYPKEHLLCFNYENNASPSIENVKNIKGDVFNIFTNRNEIVFVLKGILRFSYGDYINKYIKEGEFMLLPSQSHCAFKIEEDTSIMVFRLHINLSFCDHFSLEMLSKRSKNINKNETTFLKTNNKLELYLSLLNTCVADGLKCSYFFELKTKELLFLLRAYYSKDDLFLFFKPILTNDISFSDSVFKNHEKVKTVTEFAKLLNYSLSGFEKRFKKVFGVSVYQWMKMQKARSIYHEINCSRKTFMEISFEFGFSSPSHFNDFCKSSFGNTPGKIRKKGISNQSS